MGREMFVGRRGVGCALLMLTALTSVVPLTAGTAQSDLGVSVTVVRSCVVDAQPTIAGAPPLRLTCASGAARDVRVTESVSTATQVQSSAPQDDRVVTVNF